MNNIDQEVDKFMSNLNQIQTYTKELEKNSNEISNLLKGTTDIQELKQEIQTNIHNNDHKILELNNNIAQLKEDIKQLTTGVMTNNNQINERIQIQKILLIVVLIISIINVLISIIK